LIPAINQPLTEK